MKILTLLAILLYTTSTMAAEDALDEVNACRLKRGLTPFIKDVNLTAGAKNLADFRAKNLISGHTSNDFQGLPQGVTATAAGCGALTPDWGWGSCCTYDNYRFAGAAYTWGRDGKRYMHIFVR